ncbi:hypothetical protein Tco_0719170 [Tanacetum coccineum]
MLPRRFQTSHEENRIRKDTNAGRISTKMLERRIFVDFIRKLVPKIFGIPSVILRTKLRTISKNNGVLNKEEATFLTLNASNDFGKKVRIVFLRSLGEGQPLATSKGIKETPKRSMVDSHPYALHIMIKVPVIFVWRIEYSLVMLGKHNTILRRNNAEFKKVGEFFFREFTSLNTDSFLCIHSKRKKNDGLTFYD